MSGVDNKSGVNSVCYRLKYCVYQGKKQNNIFKKDFLRAILPVCCKDQHYAIGNL